MDIIYLFASVFDFSILNYLDHLLKLKLKMDFLILRSQYLGFK